MSSGLGAVLTYLLLTALWSVILGLYVRQHRAARGDALLTLLLSVLILDAAKTVIESAYFGLVWGANYGWLPEGFKELGAPVWLTAVKWLNVVVAVVVLGWLVRRWLPTELAERAAQRAEAAKLHRELEASLRAAQDNEERFLLATNASRDFVFDADLRTGRVYQSPRLPELLGYSEAEWEPVKPRWLDVVVHADDRQRVREAVVNALKGVTPTYEVRCRVLTRDGRVLFLQSHGGCLRDESGRATRLTGFMRDVTREVAAEEQRVEHQKLESLGLLAGGVAHDFNNLLTVLSTGLALARRRAAEGQSVGDELQTMELAVGRATALTRQLLAYVGQGARSRENLDLNELVSAMRELLSVSASRTVTFRTNLQVGLPLVQGDEGQLQQVVMNLIGNAADAIGDAEGTITLETAALTLAAPPPDVLGAPVTGKVVRLRVTDTGRGMTPQVRARIFDPFFSTKGTGRGLGLAALLGILKSHGGAVGIDSVPGRGTTFSLYLPALPPQARPTPGASVTPAPTANDALGLEVLVVDDEPLLRRVATRLLRSLGCTVTEATTGAEAVALVEANPARFDVVLMDFTMPEMNGAEAARRLVPIAPKLQVVLSSGYADTGPTPLPDTVRFFPKPWDVGALQALLRELRG